MTLHNTNAPAANGFVSAQATARHSWRNVAAGCVQLLRIRQWLKNGFVFAPLIFAGRLRDPISVATAASAFLSFSLVTSAVYVLNDWLDRDEDRLHPDKRYRPIASGLVPVPTALALAGLLLMGGLVSGWAFDNPTVVLLEGAYILINAAYSFGLKRILIADAFAVASGFVIRVLVGAAAVQVEASHWLLLCTLFLALFLSFAKRHSELRLLGQDSVNHRLVLASYSPALIGQLNVILCAVTVVSYALYTVAPETITKFGTDRLVYTVPFVLYGLFRYLYLVEIKGDGGNPSTLALRDRGLVICIVLWLLACLVIIYSSALGESR